MVEKIIVNPNKIRGYGNIMSSHTSSDYELVDCTISSGTDTVNGASATVYTLTSTASHSYSLAFSQDTYTYSFLELYVTVSCTLTDGGTPMSGETVTFSYVSSGFPVTETKTTNSNGVATLTVEAMDTTITATYQGVTAICTVEEVPF